MFGSVLLRVAAASLKLVRTARKGERMRMRFLLVLVMAFTLALAGTALAQDNPTEDAYGGVLGEEVSNSGDSEASSPVSVSQGSDSLPFTGLELGLVALAGIGLVTLGYVMRRSTRRSAESG